MITTTGHIGLNITDLSRSRRFYEDVFGFTLMGESTEAGRRYAFLGDGQKPILTLWEQGREGFARDRSGLHHIAFQAESIDEVRRAERKLQQIGVKFTYEGIVPHAEGAQSGGIFFEDPDGIRLEIFAAEGAALAPAPVSGWPTCGYF